MKFLIGVALLALNATAALAQMPQMPTMGGGSSGFQGNPYGNDSNSLRIYDNNGQFRGNLNSNQYDPNSVANPYGRYGNPYSPDSINNPYGLGSRYR